MVSVNDQSLNIGLEHQNKLRMREERILSPGLGWKQRQPVPWSARRQNLTKGNVCIYKEAKSERNVCVQHVFVLHGLCRLLKQRSFRN